MKLIFADVASTLPYIKAGKAVPLAVTDPTLLLPGTPTIAEAGFPSVQIFNSFSVLAPAGTPPAVVERLSSEIAKAMKSAALAPKLEAQALIPVFDTPLQFSISLKKEKDGWGNFIRRKNIVLEQ